MPEPKTIHWSELHGNKFLNGIHPDMLTPNGYDLKTMGRCVGMGKSAETVPLIVHFDETFVVEVIKRKLLETLQPTSYNDLQKIVSRAWKEWKSAGE